MVDLGLCKMAPEDDPDAFLLTFELVDITTRWDKGAWELRLVPYLASEAQGSYVALSEHHAKDYDKLKAAILHRVGLSPEKYHQKFRVARRNCRTHPWVFAQKSSDWDTLWLQPDSQDTEALMDSGVYREPP